MVRYKTYCKKYTKLDCQFSPILNQIIVDITPIANFILVLSNLYQQFIK